MSNCVRTSGKIATTCCCTLAVIICVVAASSSFAVDSTICLEAEQFKERGGWVVDSQFIDQMGSSFLLAHGMGKPVADAVTTFECPAATTYHVWVRTRNWTAPWSIYAAGTFAVKVNGKELPNVLGRGASGWLWQKAGEVELKKGAVTVALHDLTGFDGRCDAVCLTTGESPSRPVASASLCTVNADLVVCCGDVRGDLGGASGVEGGARTGPSDARRREFERGSRTPRRDHEPRAVSASWRRGGGDRPR